MDADGLSDRVVGDLLSDAGSGGTVLTHWSRCALSGSPGATLRCGDSDDLPPPEVNARTVRLANEVSGSADYLVAGTLGEGGMGIVFEAEQVYFGRRVALKMIKPGLASDPAAVKAFFREAVITSKLDHPGIAPIYDFGVSQDDRAFYAMKKISGTPWHRTIREKSLEENLGILDRLADIVAYAHSQGVLHRDLKPANVMLGEFGEVWLGDWGVAVRRNRSGDFSYAHPGGTPQYMPPEAAACRFDILDERGDTYLLGAILFEILTSHPPHPGDAPAACLEAAAGNKIFDGGGHELVDIARQAMQTHFDWRYATVRELQRAIKTTLDDRRVADLIQIGEEKLALAHERNEYDLFIQAIAAFDQALVVLPNSSGALLGKSKAIVAYAKAATARGEHALAESILQGLSDDSRAAPLLKELAKQKKKAVRTRRNVRALARGATIILLLAVGLAVWYYNRERNIQREDEYSVLHRPEILTNRLKQDEVLLISEIRSSHRHVTTSFQIWTYSHARMKPAEGSVEEEEIAVFLEPMRRAYHLLEEAWPHGLEKPGAEMTEYRPMCRRLAGERGELKSVQEELKEKMQTASQKASDSVAYLAMQFDRLLERVDLYHDNFMNEADS